MTYKDIVGRPISMVSAECSGKEDAILDPDCLPHRVQHSAVYGWSDIGLCEAAQVNLASTLTSR